MSHNYLSARQARSIVEKCTVSRSTILDELIQRVERKIRIYASLKEDHIVWACPYLATDLPAYNATEYAAQIVDHLAERGFYIRQISEREMYISWKYTAQIIS